MGVPAATDDLYSGGEAIGAFGPGVIGVSGTLPEGIPGNCSCQLCESLLASFASLHPRGMVTLCGIIQLDHLREKLL